MGRWLRELLRDLSGTVSRLTRLFRPAPDAHSAADRRAHVIGISSAVLLVGLALVVLAHHRLDFTRPVHPPGRASREMPDFTKPVREAPDRFPANARMPRRQEGKVSGSIPTPGFSPRLDLIRIHDERVWWESENDKNDVEDDHHFHYAMEEPMRRLIELVARKGALLKVQDAYREEGIHSKRSLHREGRAVDVTAEGIPLEELAKLCWAAGFDWVFYESPRRGGAHVHASVRADRGWLDEAAVDTAADPLDHDTNAVHR